MKVELKLSEAARPCFVFLIPRSWHLNVCPANWRDMSWNVRKLKTCCRRAKELRAKEWMKLEERVRRRAVVLWRRMGKAHMTALSAWRRAERELLPRNGEAAGRVELLFAKKAKKYMKAA
jgi:hypothetical protein